MKQLQSCAPVSGKDSDIITHILSQQCCIVFALQHGNLYKIPVLKLFSAELLKKGEAPAWGQCHKLSCIYLRAVMRSADHS